MAENKQPTLHEKWEQDNEDFKKLNEKIDTPEKRAIRERIIKEFRKKHSNQQNTKQDD